MSPLLELLVTALLSSSGTGFGTWALLRRARVEVDGDERVAEIANEPAFATELRQALADIGKLQMALAEERGRVGELRTQLVAVTAQRDSFAAEVDELRSSLAESSVRLHELNEQLTSLAGVVHGLIPTQSQPQVPATS